MVSPRLSLVRFPLFQRPSISPPGTLLLRPEVGFGDHLMLSAVIEGLKAERPELRLRLAANHPELFLHNPHLDEVLYEGRLKRRDRGRLDAYLRVSARPPSDRYLQLSGHLIDDMYARVGVPLRERPRRPRLYLSEGELRAGVRRLRGAARPRVAVVPFGKGNVRLPNKVYPADQWAELGAGLVSAYPSVLHLGTRRDGPLLPGARDLRDLGFRATAAVLAECDLLVTHVGGIMHLAAAVGTPAVVLYGAAEHPAISGYSWNRNLYVPIECGPCWMEAPCSHHSCMRRLTPQRVLGEVADWLERRA